MRKKSIILIGILFLGIVVIGLSKSTYNQGETEKNIEEEYPEILYYEVNPQEGRLHFYSNDELGNYFENHKNLKEWLDHKNKKLIFGMNGGMYLKDLSPQGLYIENGITKKNINRTKKGYGNFYLQPNGIFYITTENNAAVLRTEDYQNVKNVKYATQSGPMLLIEGKIHPKFRTHSENIHIRNGVGVLPNGNILFAMSKEKVNFYRLASFFKDNKCRNALYLDGFVSRTYLPSKNWTQEDGLYGIIIGEVE